MATRQEEFIAGEDLDDLYALLDNDFLDGDVDFKKDLAALVIEESPEFVKLSGNLRDTRIQNTAPVEMVVVFQVAAKKLFKRNYIQMCCLELSLSVQKSVSMTCVYLKRVEIFSRKKNPCLHLKTVFNCYKK